MKSWPNRNLGRGISRVCLDENDDRVVKILEVSYRVLQRAL